MMLSVHIAAQQQCMACAVVNPNASPAKQCHSPKSPFLVITQHALPWPVVVRGDDDPSRWIQHSPAVPQVAKLAVVLRWWQLTLLCRFSQP